MGSVSNFAVLTATMVCSLIKKFGKLLFQSISQNETGFFKVEMF